MVLYPIGIYECHLTIEVRPSRKPGIGLRLGIVLYKNHGAFLSEDS